MKKPPALNLEKLRFLIIDSDVNMQRLISLILRNFNIREYKVVSDADEALEVIAIFKPDIVFCEWKLEGSSGLELVQKIRSDKNSPNRLVAIIFLTAHTAIEQVTSARDIGVNEFLAKPVSPDTIYRRIVSVIDRPRTFIEADEFIGPDRRRRLDPYKVDLSRRDGDKIDDEAELPNDAVEITDDDRQNSD